MNISPEHRVLNEQERLLAASRLFGETLDRLDKFVPMQSTAAQTAMKKARRAAAALPEVARDTANAVKMGAAWHRREKTLKYAANTSGPVLADLTNSRVDRTKKEYGKKSRHEPYADSARVLRSGDADAQAYKMPFLKKGHFYSAETAVEIAVELKEREGQSVRRTATWLVQHKKVPFDENSVRSRVRKWYHDVEENLKLPETGGKRDLATKMAYSNVTAWGQVGKPTMESKSDFEAWIRTMTADGRTITREAVEEHLYSHIVVGLDQERISSLRYLSSCKRSPHLPKNLLLWERLEESMART